MTIAASIMDIDAADPVSLSAAMGGHGRSEAAGDADIAELEDKAQKLLAQSLELEALAERLLNETGEEGGSKAIEARTEAARMRGTAEQVASEIKAAPMDKHGHKKISPTRVTALSLTITTVMEAGDKEKHAVAEKSEEIKSHTALMAAEAKHGSKPSIMTTVRKFCGLHTEPAAPAATGFGAWRHQAQDWMQESRATFSQQLHHGWDSMRAQAGATYDYVAGSAPLVTARHYSAVALASAGVLYERTAQSVSAATTRVVQATRDGVHSIADGAVSLYDNALETSKTAARTTSEAVASAEQALKDQLRAAKAAALRLAAALSIGADAPAMAVAKTTPMPASRPQPGANKNMAKALAEALTLSLPLSLAVHPVDMTHIAMPNLPSLGVDFGETFRLY